VARYSILTGLPRRIVPPRSTAAYTPTLTWLCLFGASTPLSKLLLGEIAAPHSIFNVQRHLISARTHRAFRASAMNMWRVNFHRGPLFGIGHGHFSPILGYLADKDLVFVGDVNHDYMPFVVSSARLFDAMNTVDSASGLKRGFLVIDADVQQPAP
jgi:hypothetical protein